MDRWLDELARAAAGGTITRRRVLGRLLPAALAGAVGLRLASPVAAARCPGGMVACRGRCVDPRIDPQNCGSCGHACPSGAYCQAGHSLCLSTLQPPCNGTTCCPWPQTCSNNTCVCTAPAQLCSGVCTDTSFDSNNCGSCGHRCQSGFCFGGTCF